MSYRERIENVLTAFEEETREGLRAWLEHKACEFQDNPAEYIAISQLLKELKLATQRGVMPWEMPQVILYTGTPNKEQIEDAAMAHMIEVGLI